MKINWGYGIFIFILVFMAFILCLVFRCSREKVDLVSEKYYEQELAYQKQVNKLNNAAALTEKLQMIYKNQQAAVEILFPSNTDLKSLSGNINFFKPDNAGLDFNINVTCNEKYAQVIPVSKLKKGWWNIRVSWESSGTPYYHEQKILIN
jgi:nitrogen fixation protein FixH